MLRETKGYKVVSGWLAQKRFHPFLFQEQTWQHLLDNESGLVNAPTGCGKTFSVFLGALIKFINNNPGSYRNKKLQTPAYNYYGSHPFGL